MSWKLVTFVWIITIGFSSNSLTAMWGSWKTCPRTEINCFNRILLCRNNSSEAFPCHHGSEAVEEQVINCRRCNGTWRTLVTDECASSTPERSRWRLSKCSNDSTCLKRTKYLCQTLPPCEGQWKTLQEYCDTTCDKDASKVTILEGFFYFPSTSTCLTTPVTLRKRMSSRPCQNTACNEWSSWENADSCNASCGGRFQPMTRKCLNNTGCTAPKENETKHVICNVHSCAMLGESGQTSTWTKELEAWARLCCGTSGGSVLPNCSSFNSENSCDSLLYTFTIPLTTGLFLLFVIILVIIFCTSRSYKKKTRNKIQEKNQNRMSQVARTNGSLFLDLKRTSYPQGPIHTRASVQVPSEHRVEDKPFPKELDNRRSQGDFTSYDGFSSTNPVEFHRFESFPGITGTMDNSELRITKPRPSVRRAEQQRLKEEQRARRFRKKKQQEEPWSKTQTLNPKYNEIDTTVRRHSESSVHLAARSVDFLSNYNCRTSSPIKPVRRSIVKNESPTRDRCYSVGNLPKSKNKPYSSSTIYRTKAPPGPTRRMNTLQPPKKPRRSVKSRKASFNGVANKNLNISSRSSQLLNFVLTEGQIEKNENRNTFLNGNSSSVGAGAPPRGPINIPL